MKTSVLIMLAEAPAAVNVALGNETGTFDVL